MSSQTEINLLKSSAQNRISNADLNHTSNLKVMEEENNQVLDNTSAISLEDPQSNINETKRKILIVEDSNKLRTILLKILSTKYEVFGLGNAEEALEKCSKINPDIILLDIMLPGSIDGLSFLRIIKKDSQCNHIPVILMSLLSSNEIILDGLQLGANDYIIKPFDVRQLDLKIKNYLNLNKKLQDKILLEQNIHFEVKNEAQDILKKFDMLLEDTIMKDAHMPIEKYAHELNMSLSTLERIIKKNFKISPAKYILQRKLEKADILIHSNHGIPMKEIALTLGFSSLSYFCRCYKMHYGKSPSSKV